MLASMSSDSHHRPEPNERANMDHLPDLSEGGTVAKPLGATDQPLRFDGLSAADQCVHCGLCLPHCPTYGWHQVEGDSPRGRLTLMQGLAQGRLEPESPRLREHIDGCLGCRSCEAVCPARVPFGALMDRTREVLAEHPGEAAQGGSLQDSLRRQALQHRSLRGLGGVAARSAARLGLARLLPEASPLQRSMRHTEASLVRAPRLRPSASPEAAEVLLFTGCMDRFFTGPDLAAALQVLRAAGVTVAIPRGQVCCGALDQHNGRRAEAAALQQRNRETFADGEQPVIALDSGCEATLREYPEGTLGRRSISLTRWLARRIESGALEPAALWRDQPVRVALHLPCTLRNVTGEGRELPALLARLPGVTLTRADGGPNCCGAGGTAMLTEPEMADGLGAATLNALTADAPDLIISPNVGCSVHLRALAESCEAPRIVSPARFLAERLKG